MKADLSSIHVVAGPTAGGKSAYALALAKKYNGVLINCDSLQIYNGLPILTAQPTPEEKSAASHELYAALHPNNLCSAGTWREMAVEAIEKILRQGKTPIVVGGTGLYIKALMEGLSPIPDVPDEIRTAARQKQKELGNPGFYEELKKRDPVMAERLGANNTMRLVRAWEVLEYTGRSLAEWQKEKKLTPPDHWQFEIHKIMPEREELNRRCDARLLHMIEQGGLEEVEAFDQAVEAGQVGADVPLTKALGFKALRAFIRGEINREEAVSRAQTETRQYAKRQMTWFRHQF